MKGFVLTATVALLCFSGSALALTDEECATMWKNADANGDGVVTGAEADRYAAGMRAANKAVPDKWDQAAFIEDCKAGVFTTAAATEDTPPLKGANSFTEGQAKSRIADQGFANVSNLTKDENGIWRGTASKDGKNVNVAVDYKGNVVAN
jgi:hypothetical protein